jgi:integrase/recombinase XerD
MNLHDLVTHYVAFRQTLGEQCKTTEGILRAFCRAVWPETRLSHVRLKAVTEFLAGKGPLTRTWHSKHSVLKGFFEFAVSRGHLKKAPLPSDLPKRPPTLTPYIYSREELGRLLDAIPACQPSISRMEAPTLRAIVLLLYGAGLRSGEALKLSVADMDLPNALITIRGTKFYKSRLVPIGRDLAQALTDYAHWRAEQHASAAAEGRFFVNRYGQPVHRGTLDIAFKRTREHAGIRRVDGGRFQPRMHDLRHTFAVHRLTAWYRQGADVQRLIYHLSVYLGHVHLADTQVYLTMAPELLQQASTRFERWYYAGQEDHHA